MSSLTAVRPPAKSEPTIMDALPPELRDWAEKYLAWYLKAKRDFPRQGEDFARLFARMTAGKMPDYPLPRPEPQYRSVGKLAEEDPEAFDRLNDAWDDRPESPAYTEQEMNELIPAYYGQS